MHLANRRSFLIRSGFLVGGAAALNAAGLGSAPHALARSPLGTLVDYAAGIPDVDAIRAAGHVGVIRYVSDPRPDATWMKGKPLLAPEAEALAAAGLTIVSCYQFGKGMTADWRGGLEAGKRHGQRGLELHNLAGGPDAAPIYASIDDDPDEGQFHEQIAPYLRGWEAVLGHRRVGVYANSTTIDWACDAGVGSWFWQHNWGTPRGFVHPEAHLHQFEIDSRSLDGVGVDVNSVLTPEYGQW